MYRQFLLDLLEAQRYPTKTGYERLKKYADEPDVFVSYRSINKLGINPNNAFNTPYGIFCYNLKTVFNNMKGDSSNVPFAGGHPYIYVFRIKNQFKYKFINNIYEYSSADYDHDIEKLKEYFVKNHDAESRRDWNSLFEKMTQDAAQSARVKNPFGIMWNIGRILSDHLHAYYINRPIDTGYGKEKSSALSVWNVLLRKVLGYCGVQDKGQGIIHPSEPAQAVFFSKECLEEIEVIRNVRDDLTWGRVNKKSDSNFDLEMIPKTTEFKNKNIVIFKKQITPYSDQFSVKDLRTGDIIFDNISWWEEREIRQKDKPNISSNIESVIILGKPSSTIIIDLSGNLITEMPKMITISIFMYCGIICGIYGYGDGYVMHKVRYGMLVFATSKRRLKYASTIIPTEHQMIEPVLGDDTPMFKIKDDRFREGVLDINNRWLIKPQYRPLRYDYTKGNFYYIDYEPGAGGDGKRVDMPFEEN
jgi:hypothetical protein